VSSFVAGVGVGGFLRSVSCAHTIAARTAACAGLGKVPPQAQFAEKAAEVVTIDTLGTNLEELLEMWECCQR